MLELVVGFLIRRGKCCLGGGFPHMGMAHGRRRAVNLNLTKNSQIVLHEETGIIIPEKKFHLVGITSDIYPDSHYITLHYRVDGITGKPKLREPEKCAEWQWFSLDNLPSPLLLSAQKFLKTHPRI